MAVTHPNTPPARPSRPSKFTVHSKLALVTGAGSGIGRATALLLAERGARVIAVDIDAARVGEVAAQLGGRCALSRRVDVARVDEMRALADDVHAQLGPLDVLVNNAGVGHAGGILDSSLDDWRWTVDVNLWGVIHGCHFFIPPMVERGAGGHVVNLASVFGQIAPRGVAPYCTTKFAVVGLSESIRSELLPYGIGVSAICPGMIATDIVNRSRTTDEALLPRMADTFAKRGHRPEVVARAILRAVERDIAVLPVGPEAWLAYLSKRVAPGITASVSRRVEKVIRG